MFFFLFFFLSLNDLKNVLFSIISKYFLLSTYFLLAFILDVCFCFLFLFKIIILYILFKIYTYNLTNFLEQVTYPVDLKYKLNIQYMPISNFQAQHPILLYRS